MPVTIPVDDPMVAIEVLLLIHVPPVAPVGFAKVVVAPTHRDDAPVIAPVELHNSVSITIPSPPVVTL